MEETGVAVVMGVSVVETTVEVAVLSIGLVDADASDNVLAVLAAATVVDGELIEAEIELAIEVGLEATREETVVIGSLRVETEARVDEKLPWVAVTVTVGV